MSSTRSVHSWSKEFQKRRHAFENRPESDQALFASGDGDSDTLEELSGSSSTGASTPHSTQDSGPETPVSGLGLRRIVSPSTCNSSVLAAAMSRRHSGDTRASFDGQRFNSGTESDEDRLGPLMSSRHSRSRVHEIGEPSWKERGGGGGGPYGDTISPSFSSSQSQSDDSEREDTALSQQVRKLTLHNEELQEQLKERERERDRLNEQLESQRVERGGISAAYSPPGLPSRVLDGRKVIREHEPGALASPPPFASSPRGSRSKAGYSSSGSSSSSSAKKKDYKAALPESEQEVVGQIEALQRSNLDLERRLHEVLEEKRRAEGELGNQKEAFVKIQEREQDLSKDIEILRDENSHHSSAITKLKKERDSLHLENVGLHDEFTTLTEKLNKTEKCYKEVEHENLSLEAELETLVRDKRKLLEEKQNLQAAVEDTLKTKENFRSTIKHLREQNKTLESQTGKSGIAHGVVKNEKPRRVWESKEPQALSEVMSLREEKVQLRDRLFTAQREIDSLEAHLQAQGSQTASLLSEEISTHLVEFQSHLAAIYGDIESARTAVTAISSQQQVLVRESFMLLAQKCREQISAAEGDKSRALDALELSQKSLDRMEDEFEQICRENAKLQAQRSSVSDDIARLKSEVANLSDQKRLLGIQLSQNQSLVQESDKKLSELETCNKKLQDRYATSERNWKHEFGRLEREWEDKLAEANLERELLLDEKESLLAEKETFEGQLSKLQLENEKLTIVKNDLQSQVDSLESRIAKLDATLTENICKISSAECSIASLLAERACLAAEAKVREELHKVTLTEMEGAHAGEMEAATARSKELESTLKGMEMEKVQLREQASGIIAKEVEIDKLTTQLTLLTSENTEVKYKMDVLNEKHETALKNLQQLVETEQTRQLEKEKIKMTLTTEIGLLKSKLKSLEDERQSLEDRVTEVANERPQGSAFQAFPESKQIEQFKKQIWNLQRETKMQRRVSQETTRDQKAQVVDLHKRLTLLEMENKHLKETARTGNDAAEASTSLRKQVTDLQRKTFFLESEKKDLSEKVLLLQSSLKVARDVRDRTASERVQKIQNENQVLQERVRGLEESLTKKLMAADLRIVEIVKENDKLKQKLFRIQGMASQQSTQGTNLQELAKSLKDEADVLEEVQSSISASRDVLTQLDSGHQRLVSLQEEIKHILSAEQGYEASKKSPVLSRSQSTTGQNLPPVFHTLPPEYVSSLRVSTVKLSSHSGAQNFASFELREKFSQLQEATNSLVECIRKQQTSLGEKDSGAKELDSRLKSVQGELEQVLERNKELCENITGLKDEFELSPSQLHSVTVLSKQIESLQDQVIDRDVALQDIELEMKKDYEMHDKKFATLKGQVLELRKQLSAKDDLLRINGLYIQKTEERCIECESELYKVRKELERVLAEREQHPSQGMKVEEVCRLQKRLTEFSFEITQLQSQLDAVQREKSVCQSKSVEMERMHISMKEAMTGDIAYLRRLNLQLVDQQLKAEQATDILREVKTAQDLYREQRDMMKMEAELDACKLKVHEQNCKLSELEHQLTNQSLSLKLLQAEKEHSLILTATQHGQELTNQIAARPASYHRPHSAESARKPNYRIDMKPRHSNTQGRNVLQEPFSIVIPTQNSSQGSGVDILNLEERNDQGEPHLPLSLGPMVFTDDEANYGTHQEANSSVGEKATKPQRVQKLRKGHRRTASTGSNVISLTKDNDGGTGGGGGGGGGGGKSNFTQPPTVYPPVAKQKSPKYPLRPGSADSTRSETRPATHVKSPEHIVETAQEVSKYMSKLISDTATSESAPAKAKPEKLDLKIPVRQTRSLPQASGMHGALQANSTGLKLKHKYSEISRSKQVNKSTDSYETTTSEGSSSSSKSSQNGDPPVSSVPHSSTPSHQTLPVEAQPSSSSSVSSAIIAKQDQLTKDLSRTESMSSTCSTVSIFGPGSMLPSRNQSFSVYDGGESSPYSHESVEIGDSVENLQTFSKLGYNPYMTSLNFYSHKHETTSSSDEDSLRDYGRLGTRRKRSSATGNEAAHDTPRHNDMDDNSNSSCDSGNGYHGNEESHKPAIPVHRNESISLSDMEKYSTDVEYEQKVAELQKAFGRKRYSSTGSMKICYSESSNTSLEDVSKH